MSAPALARLARRCSGLALSFPLVSWLVLSLMTGCASAPSPLGLASGPPLRGGAPPGQAERVLVIAVNNPLTALPVQAGSSPGLYDRTPRYSAGIVARRLLDEVGREYGLQPLAAWPIPLLGLHCATFLLPEGADREALVSKLARDPRVSLVQPLNEFDTRGSPAAPAPSRAALDATALPATYDDPYLPLQRNLQTLGVVEAHRCARGAGVTVAVVDTGVDTLHADLLGLQSSSGNFVDDDSRQFQLDQHGTEVAGIIAARPGNAQGIVGIAPDARLLLLKACWQKGAAGAAVCNSFTLAQALSAAIDRGAQVINLSLGGPADELLGRLVQRALSKGIVVVGAAPATAGAPGFPVGIAGVISVRDGASPEAALRAPGQEVLTLTPGGRYDFGSGSSLAAAHVSAAAALLLQRQPRLDGPAIERLLRLSAARSADGAPQLCDVMALLERPCHCAARR